MPKASQSPSFHASIRFSTACCSSSFLHLIVVVIYLHTYTHTRTLTSLDFTGSYTSSLPTICPHACSITTICTFIRLQAHFRTHFHAHIFTRIFTPESSFCFSSFCLGFCFVDLSFRFLSLFYHLINIYTHIYTRLHTWIRNDRKRYWKLTLTQHTALFFACRFILTTDTKADVVFVRIVYVSTSYWFVYTGTLSLSNPRPASLRKQNKTEK